MPNFKFSIFDIPLTDPCIDLFDECNLHHFTICFDIDEIECDQEHSEILEEIYKLDSSITENEDMENSFSVSKDDYPSKEDVIRYLESKGGEYI